MTAATAAAKAICSSHTNLLPFNSNLFVWRFNFTVVSCMNRSEHVWFSFDKHLSSIFFSVSFEIKPLRLRTIFYWQTIDLLMIVVCCFCLKCKASHTHLFTIFMPTLSECPICWSEISAIFFIYLGVRTHSLTPIRFHGLHWVIVFFPLTSTERAIKKNSS